MDEAEFDQFAEQYRQEHAANIRASGEAPEFFAAYKVEDTARYAAAQRIDVRDALDFGGGIGNSVPHLSRCFGGARIVCADVSAKSLRIAEERFGESAQWVRFEGGRLPFQDGQFDLVFVACVFHHIDHREHAAWLTELRRVVRKGGLLALFEHNPWNPLTVRAVNTCPFDINARLVSMPAMRATVRAAGWQSVTSQFKIFFPAALAKLRAVEPWLISVPFGAQYVVYGRA